MERFGEMWARNTKNIKDVPARRKGGQGVYILYDGSTPVYVGKGNMRARAIGEEIPGTTSVGTSPRTKT
jgi:hypothetical protein